MSLKNNKHFRRFAAALMAGTMMVSMFGMTAFAQGSQPDYPKNVTITKEIKKELNHYAPNTQFTFTIEQGTPVEGGEEQDAIYAGPTGGAYFGEGANEITFTPQSSDIGMDSVTKTTTISIDESKFTAPGIYRYVVTEQEGNYEGIDYSDEVKYFDVYVNKDGQVYAYTFTDTTDSKAKDDGIFTNDYRKNNPGEDKGPHDLTIIKQVTGNQGNTSADYSYEFTVSVSGEVGEQYYIKTSDGDVYTLTSGESQSGIEISHNESIVVYGLTKSDVVTVTEADYSGQGYTTSYQIGTNSSVDSNTTGKISITDDTTVTFTNDRQVSTPTGVVLNIAPYIAMVALAGVLAFVFLRRRHNNF